MIRRSLRVVVIYALEAIAVLFALTLFAGGALLWRLAQGPLELDFMLADAQQRLGEAFEGDLVSLSALEARFDPDTGLLFFTARDVTVAEVGGEVVTRAPLIEAGFGLDSLFTGRLAPSRVTLEGGAVSIVRRPDGAVGAGLGSPDRVAETARPPGSGRDVDAILELLRNPDDGAALGRLTDVSIRSASIRVIDAINGLDWYVDRAELRLERNAERLQAELAGRFVTTAGFAPVAMRIEAAADLDSFLIEASAENLSPRAIAPLAGPFAAAGEISAPISLEAFASASRRDGIRSASVNLAVGAGLIGRGEAAQQLRSMTAIIEYEPIDGAIRIRQLDIDTDRLATSLTGRIFDLREFDDAFPRRWNYELAVGAGRLDLGGVFEAPPEWQAIDLSGEMNARDFEIGFDRLIAEIGPITTDLTGAARLRQVEDGRWLPDVRLVGPIEGDVSPELVLLFWPVELADGARDWIEGAVIGGRLFDAHIDLDLDAESLVAQRLPNERMTLTFAFEDAAFRYISTMTPVTGARGRATLFGNAFAVTMTEGFIGDTPVRNGFVDIPRLNPRGALARFGGEATAQAEDVLALIDEPPLNLVSDYGLDPDSITGSGEIQFEIQRPMRREVAADNVGYNIRAEFSDVTLDTGFRSAVLTDGDVVLTATPEALEAVGEARLGETETRIRWVETFGLEDDAASTRMEIDARLQAGSLDQFGIPLRRFVDGEVGLRLAALGNAFDFDRVSLTADLTAARVEWPDSQFAKAAGDVALATAEVSFADGGDVLVEQFALESQRMGVEAMAAFAGDGRLLSAEVARLFVEGVVDASGTAARPAGRDSPLIFDVAGPFFNASGLVSGLADFSGSGETPPPLALTVSFDEVRVAPETTYESVRVDWRSNESVGEMMTVRADTASGPLAFDLAAEPGERRQVALEAPDFGELLRLLDLYQNVRGGSLSITGSTPPAGETGFSDFVIESEAFTLVRMPVLARVLAAGSLPGLAALLSGDSGIAFDRLEAGVAIGNDAISITEARASGPSLGVTTEGEINLGAERLALDGVLAPSYGLNSFVGNLPVVGEALISRPGEGIIGITFSIEGPFDQPTVAANPLSVLAPGVLRRLFEGTAAERERARQDAAIGNAENAAPPEPDVPAPEPESSEDDGQDR
ncbi:AsmA-like C-terminal region-containing protein [Hyphobacterium sp.]|uniref:YhdP family protein n=1 Tax=Hyphobacterium sp. TaxID=2004662 RepID=UPI003B51A403